MAISIVPYQSGSPRLLHHIALCPAELAASLQFYRDGIGLSVLTDEVFSGPYRRLLDIPCEKLRSIFLGDPDNPHAGIVELVNFDTPDEMHPSKGRYGFFWLSFWVDVEPTLRRLEKFSLCRNPQVVELEGGAVIATVEDPDGVKIELIPNSISSEAIG